MSLVLLKNNQVISVSKIEHCYGLIDEVFGRDFVRTLQDFIDEEKMKAYTQGYEELEKENDELDSMVKRLLDISRVYNKKYNELKEQVESNGQK